jgi:hypothetical protein
MIILSFFTENGVPKLGLTPIIKIVDIDSDEIVIENDNMTALESMTHAYIYNFIDYNENKNYAILIDGGEELNNIDRYQDTTNDSKNIKDNLLQVKLNTNDIYNLNEIQTELINTIAEASTILQETTQIMLEEIETSIGTPHSTVFEDLALIIEKIDALQIIINIIKKIESNKWERTATQLIYYDDDKITPLITFNLFNKNGNPTTLNGIPYKREPV